MSGQGPVDSRYPYVTACIILRNLILSYFQTFVNSSEAVLALVSVITFRFTFEKSRLKPATFIKETSFDWTLLSGADTTENTDCNRSPRIRSISMCVF